MKTILILHSTRQQNDADHAKGVLQEELESYQVGSQCIGKEILQTKTIQFVFRDIENPAHQKYKKVDKLYISKEVMDNENIGHYEAKEKTDWVWMPTSAIIDYVMDAGEEIPKEKVPRYEIEDDKVKLRQVEIYKAHRMGYFESQEEAKKVLEKRLEKKEEEMNKVVVEKRPRKRKNKEEKEEVMI